MNRNSGTGRGKGKGKSENPDDYKVPYKGRSKYVQGVSTIKVHAPNTDGEVFIRVHLKPEDMEEIYSLYEANGRDEFRLFCYAKESPFNNNPNEDPYWWGYVRYSTYRKDLAPKSIQEMRDKFFKNDPATKGKYYSPSPQPQSYKKAWKNPHLSDAVTYKDYVESGGGDYSSEEDGEDEEGDYIPF